MVAASLVATVSGDPTYSDPLAISARNLSMVGRAHPRSRDDVSSIAAQCGHWISTASPSVLATYPWEWTPTGSGGGPYFPNRGLLRWDGGVELPGGPPRTAPSM